MDAALNWLWQGCVVALAWSVLARLLERARANVRHVVCWAALLLVLGLPALPLLGPEPQVRAALPGPMAAADPLVSVPDAWWTSSVVVLGAWVAWASVSALRFARAVFALRRARACVRAFPPQLESALRHWQQVRGRGRRAALVLSESVPAAAVLGCGAPIIAVAPELLRTLDADELDRVVLHEWAHVQRRDDLAGLLQLAVRSVAGWHPAVWWIERGLHAEREIACDELAVAVTGTPQSYAACLVKVACLRSAAPALAAPAVLTVSGLRARVTRIVAQPACMAPARSRGLAACIVSTLCVVSIGLGSVRLVDAAAFALPIESIRTAATPAPLAPLGVPAPDLAAGFVPPRRRTVASTQVPTRAAPAPPPPARVDSRVPAEPESPAGTTADGAAGAPPPDVPAPDVSAPDAIRPEPAAAVTIAPRRAPWSAVADGGAAVGRKTKEAGVATAGFFTRMGRRVAGSFER
jgi:beta-lactamase regulating signal transducer with metallopeptidase domain